jgi:alginate O-acetyltransferase complex protein AlgI
MDGEGMAAGVSRFVRGFAKKLLVANVMGAVADSIFSIPIGELTCATAWLGAISYSLQIYFDFSGYSDMAIGLARIFGFYLPENFILPYGARSVREFWRRWHVSLSTWFRDYLYIPLGGNRSTPAATYRNLMLVFFLCGLWHGASWTFVVWGCYHGLFLVLERLPFGRWIDAAWAPLARAYTLLVVIVGWVFFRSDSFSAAGNYLSAMAGLHSHIPIPSSVFGFLSREVLIALVAGIIGSTVPMARVAETIEQRLARSSLGRFVSAASATTVQLALFALSIMYMASSTYNPFIYFRF